MDSIITKEHEHVIMHNGALISLPEMKFTVDAHGCPILYGTEPLSIDDLRRIEIAYKDCPFVTLDKHDAEACYQQMEEAIPKLGGEEPSDEEVYGDDGISFERLFDRVCGMIYPVAAAGSRLIYQEEEERKKKENEQ